MDGSSAAPAQTSARHTPTRYIFVAYLITLFRLLGIQEMCVSLHYNHVRPEVRTAVNMKMTSLECEIV
jgi:hypothetical protein